jgi:flagellar hook protein FlgE
MNAITAAAQGVTNAFDRFARESDALLRSVSGVSDEDPARAIVGQIEAKAQLKASLATIRVADEMLQDLLSLQE